eukprot:CAMPEP_0173398402 /NCGR_PEP_ID=MMETSP1356-20130122/41474_1 /TAXON_ID=77927 ORGANISM="Hemiselmis virescens, Strain PCC157" /NCGR_SAMPLE_ID=MMETSP1356 /ASSEMBLY_ACC=CAM_ASM_000847 /LENGTH=97 /DNA_ID=CAMNT_0014357879 /DNA_START=165 /DNA_END=455 /DNA_ORIENTATION=+
MPPPTLLSSLAIKASATSSHDCEIPVLALVLYHQVYMSNLVHLDDIFHGQKGADSSRDCEIPVLARVKQLLTLPPPALQSSPSTIPPSPAASAAQQP